MKSFLTASLFVLALPAALAVPPPPEQLGADCENPVYASDQLVCATPSLRALDNRVAALAARDEARLDAHMACFRASRRCAFEAGHAACLQAAYCAQLALLDRAGADWPAECVADANSYIPAKRLSRAGFARDAREAERLDGREIALAGFVDHGNLFGDAGAREILGDWWGGPGPDADHWRFDLKARPDDPVGHSFTVVVPNGPVREALLMVFRADAEAGRPTPVFLRGIVSTFDAPVNAVRMTGLRVALRSASDIRLGPALKPSKG